MLTWLIKKIHHYSRVSQIVAAAWLLFLSQGSDPKTFPPDSDFDAVEHSAIKSRHSLIGSLVVLKSWHDSSKFTAIFAFTFVFSVFHQLMQCNYYTPVIWRGRGPHNCSGTI